MRYARQESHFSGWTGNWRQGDLVVGSRLLAQGTAIATFVDGKYANHTHGNHAAFYMGQVSDGIYIMDQWHSKAKISKRFIRRKKKTRMGSSSIHPTMPTRSL